MVRISSVYPHHGEGDLQEERTQATCYNHSRVRVQPLRLITLKQRSKSTRRLPPCWRILPPEIIHIIAELLGDDKATYERVRLPSAISLNPHYLVSAAMSQSTTSSASSSMRNCSPPTGLPTCPFIGFWRHKQEFQPRRLFEGALHDP